jgi:hypothetical protein
MIRILPGLTVPALAGVLSFVLIGHLGIDIQRTPKHWDSLEFLNAL